MKAYCADCGERYQDENLSRCERCGEWNCYRCYAEHSSLCHAQTPFVAVFSEEGGRVANARRLALLFGLMQRTRCICARNIANDLNEIGERFWIQYYDTYLAEVLLSRALEHLDNTVAELYAFLVQGTHLVQRLRHQHISVAEPPPEILAMRVNTQQTVEDPFYEHRYRGRYRRLLLEEIRAAFLSPDQSQSVLDQFWGDTRGASADHAPWQARYPQFFSLLDQALAHACP